MHFLGLNICAYFSDRIGRRVPLVIYFLIGGVALLSTLPIVLTGTSYKQNIDVFSYVTQGLIGSTIMQLAI